MCNSYSPDSSEKKAIDLPSGDHDGSRSATAGVCVRLRTSPFSAGTVKISPRASNTARAPEGEIPALDRKSTRLNSSHVEISYAVFCLKKKKKKTIKPTIKNDNTIHD